MAIQEIRLVTLDGGVAIFQVGPALAQRLHLGSGESNPGFDDLLDLVIVPRPPIRAKALPFLFWSHPADYSAAENTAAREIQESGE
jgi:hypothetical protein